MKYIYTINLFLLISITSSAQIGINTENLVSGAIFQADPLNNSTSGGTGLADDMIISCDNSGAALAMGLGKKSANSAQLDLASHKKALKMNEVTLQSLTDVVTVPNPRAGMVVYNTVSIAAQDVEIGWYYFDGVKWNRILKAEKEPVLKNEFSIIQAEEGYPIPGISLSDATSGIYSGALKMPFINTTTNSIKAPTDGTYVFALRLYSFSDKPYTTTYENYTSQSVLYVFMISKTQNRVLDKAVFSFPYTQEIQRYYSYRLVLGTQLNKDEEVEFYIARGQAPDFDNCTLNMRVLDSSDPSLKAASRTSLVFWKL